MWRKASQGENAMTDDVTAAPNRKFNFRSWQIYLKGKLRDGIDWIINFFYRYLVVGLFLISSILYISMERRLVDLPSELLPYINRIPEFVLGPCLFYFFLYLREKKVNDNLKHVALLSYFDFKKNVIMQFQFMLQGSSCNPEDFFELNAFRKTFGKDNWYGIANALQEQDLQAFRNQAKFLRDELIQLLSAKRSTNKQAFTMLKVLCWQLSDIEAASNDYESRKSLLRQLWSLFSGWSFISGYTNRDLIEKAIQDL